jgi:hypothetical protein
MEEDLQDEDELTGAGARPTAGGGGHPKARQAAAPKRCIFCQQAKKMSREHIWGDWLKAYVRPAMNKHNFQAVRINRPGEQTTDIVTLRAGDPLRSKVKVVCADCNNRWLSEIQNRARPLLIPLITGERIALGSVAQERVGAWCAMATMTAEFIDRDPTTIAVPQSDRDWLRNNGMAPRGWWIWLAHYQRRKWPAQWVHLTLPILAAKDVPENAAEVYVMPNTQVTTFVVGSLFVHTMSSVEADNIAGWASMLPRRYPLLVPVMPQRESFVAWPSASITDATADAIASAFHRYVEGISRSLLGRRLF